MPIPFYPGAKTKKLSVSSNPGSKALEWNGKGRWILKGFDSKAFEGIMFENEKLRGCRNALIEENILKRSLF